MVPGGSYIWWGESKEDGARLSSTDFSRHSDKIESFVVIFLLLLFWCGFFFFTGWVVKQEQVAQRGCGLSILGDTQNPSRDSAGLPAVADSALSKLYSALHQPISRGTCSPELSGDAKLEEAHNQPKNSLSRGADALYHLLSCEAWRVPLTPT